MPEKYTREKAIARFYERIAPPNNNGCKLWTAARTRDPYGNPSYGHVYFMGKHFVAHRLAWILEKGEVPDGLQVLHKCDVTNCCNTDHLFLGTTQDNMIDRKNKNRHTRYPDRDPVTGQWRKKNKG